jgi:hypothetical protein
MMNEAETIKTTNSNNSTSRNTDIERTFPSWSNEELRNALASLLHDRPVRIEVAGGIVRHHCY